VATRMGFTVSSVAVALATAVLSIVPMQTALAAPSCTGYMHNPHISTAGGINAKAQWICNASGTLISFTLTLWKCGDYPQEKTKEWLDDNCQNKGNNIDTITAKVAGELTTPRYVPPTSTTPGGAHGTGYWVAVNSWTTVPLADGGDRFSNIVFLSA
jgi:hypothetical protein